MTATARLVDYMGRGLAAALPAPGSITYAPDTAAVFWATDTETLYLLNEAGTAWQTLVVPSGLTVTDGSHSEAAVTTLTFSGAVVSTTGAGEATVTVSGGSLSVTDGTTTEAAVTALTFSGATVSTTGAGEATVTISGGGGGGGGGGGQLAYAYSETVVSNTAPTTSTLVDSLTATFTLAATTTVEVSWNIHADNESNNSGQFKTNLQVDGTPYQPGGSTDFFYTSSVDDSTGSGGTLLFVHGSVTLTLAAGSHTIEVMGQVALATFAVSYLSRNLKVSPTSAGGGSLTVTDGTTTEAAVTALTFSGATVSATGAGEATVTISGGGGGGFDYFSPFRPTVPVASGFTKTDGSAITSTLSDLASGRGVSLVTSGSTGGYSLSSIIANSLSVSSSAWKYKFQLMTTPIGNPMECGIVIKDTTGKLEMFGLINGNIGYDTWNNESSNGGYSGAYLGGYYIQGALTGGPFWLKLELASGNFIFSVSKDGESWATVYTGSASGWVNPASLAGIGIGMYSASGDGLAVTVLAAMAA